MESAQELLDIGIFRCYSGIIIIRSTWLRFIKFQWSDKMRSQDRYILLEYTATGERKTESGSVNLVFDINGEGGRLMS